jgi:hypothetical protein
MSRRDDAQIVDSWAKNTDPWTDAMIKNHLDSHEGIMRTADRGRIHPRPSKRRTLLGRYVDTSALIAHLTAEATYFE